MNEVRQKLVLVADVKNWAFCNIATHIRKNLSHRYDIAIIYQDTYDNWFDSIDDAIFERNADIVHFFWRETALNFFMNPWVITGFLKMKEISVDVFATRIANTVITTSIYDHLFLEAHEIEDRQGKISFFDGYSASSVKLRDIYRDRYGAGPTNVIQDGVDTELFTMWDQNRFDSDQEKRMVVGWVGNSTWNLNESGIDSKGFNTIVKPVISELEECGYPISGLFADKNIMWIPREEMPAYYNSIDILVCASQIEGTPNPILEAMACGVPVITTNVGVVNEVLGPKQSRYIIDARNAETLKKHLIHLCENREELAELSAENLRSIESHTWQDKMTSWLFLWDSAQERNMARRSYKEAILKSWVKERMHTDDLESELQARKKANHRLRETIHRLHEEREVMNRRLAIRVTKKIHWLWRGLKQRRFE